MPIYEYRCTKCLKTFERFQKISDRPLEECPDCSGKVERLISQTSFTLKGSGWYKDGYTSSKGGGGGKKEGGEKKGTGEAQSSKSKEQSSKQAQNPKSKSRDRDL